jgi:hypothetical protein
MAAFSVSMIAESEHARSQIFDNPESVYRACADMKLFSQEVLRCVLFDTRQRLISCDMDGALVDYNKPSSIIDRKGLTICHLPVTPLICSRIWLHWRS